MLVCMLGAAFVQRVNLLILVVGLFVAPLPGAMLLGALNLRRLRFERRLPAELFVGKPFLTTWRIENLHQHTAVLGVRIEDRAPAEFVRGETEMVLPALAPGEIIELGYSATPTGRGRFRFGHLIVRSTFPMGIFLRTIHWPLPREVVVFPRIGAVTGIPVRRSARGWQTAREGKGGKEPGHEQYRDLREFREGDDPRRIHWRTSARRGKLILKEFEAKGGLDVILLIEAWLPQPTPEARANLEWIISLAASLSLDILRDRETRLTVAIAGEMPRIVTGHLSRGLYEQILTELALTRGTAEPSIERCLAEGALQPLTGRGIYFLTSRVGAPLPAPMAQLATICPIVRIDPADPRVRLDFAAS